MPVRPQGAKNGAVFAIMVNLNADNECRGTIFIGLVICHGLKSGAKPVCAVSRDKHNRTKKLVTVQKFESGSMSVSGFKITCI
jgi:hypothetical protein